MATIRHWNINIFEISTISDLENTQYKCLSGLKEQKTNELIQEKNWTLLLNYDLHALSNSFISSIIDIHCFRITIHHFTDPKFKKNLNYPKTKATLFQTKYTMCKAEDFNFNLPHSVAVYQE